MKNQKKNQDMHRTRRRHGTRRLWLAATAVALLAAGNANAQWQVTDELTHEGLDRLDGRLDTTNKHLAQSEEYLRRLQSLGAKAAKHEEAEAIPEERKLAKVEADYGIERCGKHASTAVSNKQLTLCQDIVRTQNAQYNYMVAMYDITEKRKEAFDKIVQEREGLSEDDGGQGKLQDNTNKLIALQTLMQVDRQRTVAAMNAFETRLRVLNQRQMRLTEDAMSGRSRESAGGSGLGSLIGGLGQIGGSLVAGTVLAGALESAKSQRPSGMPRRASD